MSKSASKLFNRLANGRGCSAPSQIVEHARRKKWPNVRAHRADSQLAKRLDEEVRRVTSLAKAEYQRQHARTDVAKAAAIETHSADGLNGSGRVRSHS
jgi:hypothetical protein